MNKRMKKLASLLMSGCIVTGSFSVPVAAHDLPRTNASYGIGQSQEENILEPKVSHSRIEEAKVARAAKTAGAQYTMAELNRLDYPELVEVIASCDWSDIIGLFQYSEEATTFYLDDNRMQALRDAIYTRGTRYTDEDDMGIPTLIEVLRAGYYLAYYNEGLEELKTEENQKLCLEPILAIQNNPNFKLGTEVQDQIIKAVGLLINSTTCNVEIVQKYTPIIADYNTNINTYIKDSQKGSAVFESISGIQRSLNVYRNKHRISGAETPWFGKIDKLIEEFAKVIALGDRGEEYNWLINNGIYHSGKLAKFHSNPIVIQKMVEEALTIYPYLSEPYLKAIERIGYDFSGVDSNGKEVNLEAIKEKGKKHYLPRKYTFDDGKVIIHAGDKVSEEKIQKLYWASKEVKAQFHRVIGEDSPLEKGNADDVLTVVIYNDPKEYKLNLTLYGYSTDNGGIYIENTGTFFTYERTPEESVFSLEELFRHEFTHYLQCRYLVKGMWGNGDFYKGNTSRLTWLEEGSAEFFAGATRTDNILPRQTEVGGLSQDASKRFNVDTLVHSKYGSWEFYYYGFAFSDYMYNRNPVLFNEIIDSIITNDVSGYERIMEKLSSDTTINKEYQEHMENLREKYHTLTTPLVADDYIEPHVAKGLDAIRADIEAVTKLQEINVVEHSSDSFDTFTLYGTYVGELSEGESSDWNKMNDLANSFLKQLDKYAWSGYKTLTCYFVNHRVNGDGKYEYDVVFHGINTDDGVTINKEPVAAIQAAENATINQEVQFSGENSVDQDGEIVSYAWEFGDGNISTEVNPKHSYEKTGIYTVTLEVTDNQGLKNKIKFEITVNKEIVIPAEKEHSFEAAVGPLLLGKTVTGEFTKPDSTHFYYVNLEEEGNVHINLKNKDNLQINWTVYAEANTEEYIAYPKIYGESITGDFIAKPGKYYIVVYGVNNAIGTYNLTLDGDPQSEEPSKPEVPVKPSELEANDSFDTVVGNIAFNEAITGMLEENDNKDIYAFELEEDDAINISLDNKKNIGMSWLLYSEDNLTDYIAYPQSTNQVMEDTTDLKAGKYYLMVYKFKEEVGNYELFVNKKRKIEDSIIVEIENNDTYETAQEIPSNRMIEGGVDALNREDMFSFKVADEKDLEITVTKLNEGEINWLLYREDDLQKYIVYADINENVLRNSFVATEGKYYLCIYNVKNNSVQYQLEIKE